MKAFLSICSVNVSVLASSENSVNKRRQHVYLTTCLFGELSNGHSHFLSIHSCNCMVHKIEEYHHLTPKLGSVE